MAEIDTLWRGGTDGGVAGAIMKGCLQLNGDCKEGLASFQRPLVFCFFFELYL